jgi:aspartate/methionine/tyrosine aminotransferase
MNLAARIDRLQLPEREAQIGMSVGAAERDLLTWPTGADVLNATHADTHRFPPPPWALEDFVASASGAGKSYTAFRGDAPILEAVAPNVSRLLGVDVDPRREFAITPGSQAALFAALAALIEPGDRVVLVDPDYLSSERMVRFVGGELDHVPLVWDGGSPSIDLDALREALARDPRLVLFSHPNNPTGAVYSPELIAEVAELLRNSDAWILVDELYARLVYDGRPFAHLIAERGMKERCVTTLGPSKTESMSGYRLGVVVAPETVIDAIEDVIAITAIRAPAYAQRVLIRWLADDEEFLRRRIADYQALRDMTVERLNALDGVRVELPGGTAYAFVDVSSLGLSDQDIARRLLATAEVVVNPGYQFGPRGIGSFRLCFAQEEERWSTALDRVGAVLGTLTGARV